MIKIKEQPQPQANRSLKRKINNKQSKKSLNCRTSTKPTSEADIDNENSPSSFGENKKKDKLKEANNQIEELENKALILTYGPQLYEFSRSNENLTSIPYEEGRKFDLFKNHDVTSQIRTKLVDWLFEVLYAYKCDENCMYLTFHLMDSFIAKSRVRMTNNDMHLLGVSCFFIASKTEDLAPVDMQTLKTKIAHNKFTEKDIKRKERQILELLEFRILLTSTNDFIRNFIFDFTYNNKKMINKLNIKSKIHLIEKTANYLSKIILHCDKFSHYKSSLKAIACIIAAFDLVRSNVSSFNQEMESFTNEWINFLIEQSRYNPNQIYEIYQQIGDFYKKFYDMSGISHNLKQNSSLDF